MEATLKKLETLISEKDYRGVYRIIQPIIAGFYENPASMDDVWDFLQFLAHNYQDITHIQGERDRDLQDAIQSLLPEGLGGEQINKANIRVQFQYKKLTKTEIGKILHLLVTRVLEGSIEGKQKIETWDQILAFLNADPDFFLSKIEPLLENFLASGESQADPYYLIALERILDYFPAQVLEVCFEFLDRLVEEGLNITPRSSKIPILLETIEKFVDIYPELSGDSISRFLQLARSREAVLQKFGVRFLQLMENNEPGCLEPVLPEVIDLIPLLRSVYLPQGLILLRESMRSAEDDLLDRMIIPSWIEDPLFPHLFELLEMGISDVTDTVVEILLRFPGRIYDRMQDETNEIEEKKPAFFHNLLAWLGRIRLSFQPTFFSVLHIKEFLETLVGRSFEVRFEPSETNLLGRLDDVLEKFRQNLM